MKKLAIIGSKDLAIQIAGLASSCGYEVVGFFDDFKEEGWHDNQRILGKIENAANLFSSSVFDELILAVGYQNMPFRKQIFESLKLQNIPFATLIHPSCIIDESVKISAGSVVYAGCILDQRVEIGENVLLNLACVIAHDTKVDSHSFLAPAIKIAGFCKVDQSCFLGIGSVLIDNIHVTANCYIGGGSVVVKNIEQKGRYVGIPCRKISDAQ
jgi:sugar O-acyltransferase (sialic acid O-acetyltransferase NeuD family)